MNLTNGKFYTLQSFPVAKFIDPVRELKPALKGLSHEIDLKNVD
jgi:hypothetical protein